MCVYIYVCVCVCVCVCACECVCNVCVRANLLYVVRDARERVDVVRDAEREREREREREKGKIEYNPGLSKIIVVTTAFISRQ